jgi:rhodanese-related sulfurtransferase
MHKEAPLILPRPARSLTFLFLITSIALAGCAATMTPEELLKRMQEGTVPHIIDVRSQGEFDRDHVPGAVHISFYSIAGGLQEIVHSKDEPVVLYCEHGPRAGIAAAVLSVAGYGRVYSLEGHMKNWRANAFPLEIVKHDSTAR